MSAIKLVGAHTLNNQTSGKTGGAVPGPLTPGLGGDRLIPLPEGVPVLQSLDSILGGGQHPEGGSAGADTGIAIPSLSDGLTRASDSVRGAFGGLRPRPSSTVAPGPAGGVAQRRGTYRLFELLRNRWREVGGGWIPGTHGRAGPTGTPIVSAPAVPGDPALRSPSNRPVP